MSENTKIQWCHHTYNPWRGCRKVAPECQNCYIVTTPPFRSTGQTHGSARVRAGDAHLAEPAKWDRKAAAMKERHRVFCLSLGDWLDDENVPIAWLATLLQTINETPNLDWLLLTKRPQNWEHRIAKTIIPRAKDAINDMAQMWLAGFPPPNVWIGVSAGASQQDALNIPAPIHFLSCEPMLGPMDETHAARFDWIIFGGESGAKARHCHTDWMRDGLGFCRQHRIAPFVKQLGANAVAAGRDQKYLIAMKDKKGGNMDEWPEDLRVREFPK